MLNSGAAGGLGEVEAVILAGGLGTRLRGLFPDLPKCLAPVNHRPFLHYTLSWLAEHGVRRVVLALGYRAAQVLQSLTPAARGEWPQLSIDHVIETVPMGTGGALKLVLPKLKSTQVLIVNGDSYTHAPLDALLDFHQTRHARLTLLLTHREDVSGSGLVTVDDLGVVTQFCEKPAAGGSGAINAGVYLCARPLLDELPCVTPLSLEKEVFPGLVGQGFYAFSGSFPFIDIGTPETHARAEAFFQKIRP